MKKQDYYLGLDIGTDSVGWAVTNTEYDLLKWHGDPMWGVTLFNQNENANAKRRSSRISRRRLARRKQRVALVQELFASEIAKVDPKFYIRMQESALWREDAAEPYSIFNDEGYTDQEYHNQYPTIHHLIVDLMKSDKPHDVRLVYLACAWLVAHRGHFLSDINKENITEMTNFETVYRAFTDCVVNLRDNATIPWNEDNLVGIRNILLKHIPVTRKYCELLTVLYSDGKAPTLSDEYPYGIEAMWKLLCGSKVSVNDLFPKEDYSELGSVSLNVSDEELEDLIGKLGDDAELIVRMKALYDQVLLSEVLNSFQTISEAKVAIFEQHKADLLNLKAFVKKYIPDKFNNIFRDAIKGNYTAYSRHVGKKNQKLPKDKGGKEEFSDWLNKIIKSVNPDEEDLPFFEDMILRLKTMSFLPKQTDGDNRVIPYQLYWYELRELLTKAEGYLCFLGQKDEDGLSVTDKLLSIMEFRIPYFVGPLNKASNYHWLDRTKEKIYPWNFEKVVNLENSEKGFIEKMMNRCTYLPDKTVLPKDSLLYHRYMVLNEINNIRIDGVELPVEYKQAIYKEVFEKRRKVTYKALIDFMTCRGYMMPGQSVTGIDIKINADLKPQHDFARLMSNGVLTEKQVEQIIERITYTTDKIRLKKWLAETYPDLSQNDVDYIARLNYKEFGRLSRKLLEFEGYDKHTGEVATIMSLLWTTNKNLMELMSEQFSFAEEIKKQQDEYYATHALKLDERLNEMWLPNAVKRPVLQALKLTREIKGLVGCAPKKIFVEVTRGATEEQKNKRTSSRREQILELYKKCKDEDVRILKQELESLGERVDDKLRGDALFLYFMQQGRSMYSGSKLDISKLGTAEYNIDHIYPESKSGDDSLLNNKVLVLSTENGQKGDRYPIDSEVRSSMHGFWDELHKIGAVNDEKYRRLTRSTPFTEEEQLGFVGRQLTQTSQAVKAVAELLQEYFPDTEIVYTKAKLVSNFRQTFNILKSRTFNDLHHAKDAYLNVVTGNVFNMRFSKRWFSLEQDYNLKTKPLFTHPVICGEETVWDGQNMLAKVLRTCARNNAKETVYSYSKGGELLAHHGKLG